MNAVSQESGQRPRIAIIGLGYVGLPLAVEFGKQYPTLGFDINESRLAELKSGIDSTLEVSQEELANTELLSFSSSAEALAACTVFIVTVPTPIDAHKRPNLRPLISASEMIGKVLKVGDTVIYESTVYPGATEEDCVPVLEAGSGLVLNKDFSVGYSPERINPGDSERRLPNIMKVTSGSNEQAADFIDELYRSIITAGTYRAQSIKVAEAAKVIENTQRDLNIALINELALIFNQMNIDTESVLKAAGTKWNFLPFRPGLVGGHCIGVDPYYLTHKAQQIGYHPEVILAGRRINDGMGRHVVSQLVKALLRRKIQVDGARVLLMGLAFKENCPDIRNTKVVDIVAELAEYNVQTDIYDPWVDTEEAMAEYGLQLVDAPESGAYDAVIVAVAHEQFKGMSVEEYRALGKDKHALYDLKYVLPCDAGDLRL